MKNEYIQKNISLMEQCNDLAMLDLIMQLLSKSIKEV